MNAGKHKRARLIDYFFFRLWKYAESITDYPLAEIEEISESRQTLGNRLVEFTLLDVVEGSYSYKGKRFDFVDYQAFCCSLCALLNDEEFFIVNSIAEFVHDMHVSMKAKKGWNEFFESDN